MVIVGVGASAGGLEAFKQLVGALPDDTGMAYVLVQHLDARHESIMAELLAKTSRIPVSEVRADTAVKANHVYVAPGKQDVTIESGVLKLVPRTNTRGQHMPIDSFLRTLAEAQGAKAIGVVLSGTASDGTLGLKAIKAEGGITFAQEPDSASYDGMPRSAMASGCVDFVLPPAQIAEELARLSRHPYVNTTPRVGDRRTFRTEGQGRSEGDRRPGPKGLGCRFRLVQGGNHPAADRAAHGARPRRDDGGLPPPPGGPPGRGECPLPGLPDHGDHLLP